MLSQSIRENILSDLTSNKNELNELLRKLIQIRSYSGHEEDIVKFIQSKMVDYGFDDAFIDSFGNVIGKIGNGPIKILYDAHVDTVEVTDFDEWKYPPFEGKIVNNMIYGRGAVDEKPAMAGYLMAAKLLKTHSKNIEFPFTLYIVGSVLEEDVDGYPLFHIIKNERIKPDYVLLGEPTNLRVYCGQRGRMELKITTSGKSAHGAHNEQGINAIYKMIPIIEEIEKLDRQLPIQEPLGKGSITVSQVKSKGPSLCSVPDLCQIHVDRRLTIDETRETVMQELNGILRKTGIDGTISVPKYNGESWKGTRFSLEAFFPTWLIEEQHPLTQAGLKSAELVLNQPGEPGFWKFSTNGVATAGHCGIPTIGFAPGREELSHSCHEKLLLDDLFKATLFYCYFSFELCKIL